VPGLFKETQDGRCRRLLRGGDPLQAGNFRSPETLVILQGVGGNCCAAVRLFLATHSKLGSPQGLRCVALGSGLPVHCQNGRRRRRGTANRCAQNDHETLELPEPR